MKKYRLTEDAFGRKKGVVFEENGLGNFVGDGFLISSAEAHILLKLGTLEEVGEKGGRWKPGNKEMYLYVHETGETCVGRWNDEDDVHRVRWEFGNCFRTSEEAKTAAEKIKALLLGMHDNT